MHIPNKHNAEKYKCGFSKRPPLHQVGENRAEEGRAPARSLISWELVLHGAQKVSCLEYLPDGQALSIMLQERRMGQQASLQVEPDQGQFELRNTYNT